MKKSERLLQLLVLLRGRRRAVTAAQLAERLEVSERTVYRDIQSLLLSGVDIEGEAGVGYSLRPGSGIPPLMFNEEELEALVLGIRLVKGWADDELIQAAESAQQKIRAVLPSHTQQQYENKHTKYLVPDNKRRQRLRYSEEIRSAIDERRILALNYKDEKGQQSRRRIYPLGMMFWGEAWTVVAWCELREDYRLFRLDRIDTAELQGEHFETGPECSFADYISRYEQDIKLSFWE